MCVRYIEYTTYVRISGGGGEDGVVTHMFYFILFKSEIDIHTQLLVKIGFPGAGWIARKLHYIYYHAGRLWKLAKDTPES